MDNKIEISIVIPNLNSPIIDKTIEAIKNQTYDMSKVEIIVIGQDKYGLIKECDNVKFIYTQQEANPAKARNIGCEYAKGEVILFTDADCMPDRNWIQNLMKHHKRGVNIVAGAVDINFEGANYWSLSDNIGSFFFQLMDQERGTFKGKIVGTLNFSIKRDIFFKIGRFDETFKRGQDAEFIARLRKLGYEIYFEPEAVVQHHSLRNSFKSVVNHAILYGRYFPKLVEKHPKYFTKRRTLYMNSKSSVWTILSPIKALVETWSIFWRHRTVRKYWYTCVGVFVFRFFIYYSISRNMRKFR